MGALEAQVVLLRVGLGVEETLLHVLLGLAYLLEPHRGAVGDIEAAAAGLVRVEDGQGGLGVVEGQAVEPGDSVDLVEQGAEVLQPLEVALDLEQLHMVRGLPCGTAAQGRADVLHLAQDGHDLGVGVLQLLRGVGGLLHVIQLALQLRAFLRGVKPQAADALLAEGRAAVERLQHILQADLHPLVKMDLDHANSSFTLITGTSTASRIRSRNSSLSNFQP